MPDLQSVLLPEKKYKKLSDMLRVYTVKTELDRKLIKGLFEQTDSGEDKDEEREEQPSNIVHQEPDYNTNNSMIISEIEMTSNSIANAALKGQLGEDFPED